MRPGGTPEGIIVSGSNVDPVHSTDTRVPPGSEALPGLLLKFNIPPRLKWAKAVGLEFGHFERVTLPRDRCGFMVGSRFRVTGVASGRVTLPRDRNGDTPKADLTNVASRSFGTIRSTSLKIIYS